MGSRVRMDVRMDVWQYCSCWTPPGLVGWLACVADCTHDGHSHPPRHGTRAHPPAPTLSPTAATTTTSTHTQVTQVRVTDYTGCSLSTLTKSVVTIAPACAEAAELRAWYEAAGMSPDRFTPVGQDLAGARSQ
jgi:hypothetical protein